MHNPQLSASAPACSVANLARSCDISIPSHSAAFAPLFIVATNIMELECDLNGWRRRQASFLLRDQHLIIHWLSLQRMFVCLFSPPTYASSLTCATGDAACHYKYCVGICVPDIRYGVSCASLPSTLGLVGLSKTLGQTAQCAAGLDRPHMAG